MPRPPGYHPGDWIAVCYQCGHERLASTMRKHWQGYWVCPEHWEPRHPQDFVRAVKDEMTGAGFWSQGSSDIQFDVCGLNDRIAMPGYVLPGCCVPGWTQLFPDAAPPLLTSMPLVTMGRLSMWEGNIFTPTYTGTNNGDGTVTYTNTMPDVAAVAANLPNAWLVTIGPQQTLQNGGTSSFITPVNPTPSFGNCVGVCYSPMVQSGDYGPSNTYPDTFHYVCVIPLAGYLPSSGSTFALHIPNNAYVANCTWADGTYPPYTGPFGTSSFILYNVDPTKNPDALSILNHIQGQGSPKFPAPTPAQFRVPFDCVANDIVICWASYGVTGTIEGMGGHPSFSFAPVPGAPIPSHTSAYGGTPRGTNTTGYAVMPNELASNCWFTAQNGLSGGNYLGYAIYGGVLRFKA